MGHPNKILLTDFRLSIMLLGAYICVSTPATTLSKQFELGGSRRYNHLAIDRLSNLQNTRIVGTWSGSVREPHPRVVHNICEETSE